MRVAATPGTHAQEQQPTTHPLATHLFLVLEGEGSSQQPPSGSAKVSMGEGPESNHIPASFACIASTRPGPPPTPSPPSSRRQACPEPVEWACPEPAERGRDPAPTSHQTAPRVPGEPVEPHPCQPSLTQNSQPPPLLPSAPPSCPTLLPFLISLLSPLTSPLALPFPSLPFPLSLLTPLPSLLPPTLLPSASQQCTLSE